jgi:hypothetical protein
MFVAVFTTPGGQRMGYNSGITNDFRQGRLKEKNLMDTTSPWPRCPEAAAFFERQFAEFAAANPVIETMAKRFHAHAGVNLFHLVDHWTLPEGSVSPETLAGFGLVELTAAEGDRYWKHPDARLPLVRFKSRLSTPRLALHVEDVAFFAHQNNLTLDACHGDPDSRYECGHVALPNGELMPIARRGYAGFAPGTLDEGDRDSLEGVRTAFWNRNRAGDDIALTRDLQALFTEAAEVIGRDRAVEEFFGTERDYWMGRNRAGQWQYDRQQELGIGWSNHDHHTYRSSRTAFRSLMELWQTMGFIARERFYAGAEAGWGAQVLEHEVCPIILFCDLDIAPEELDIDFANTDLPERDTLGTIGLWCALHGDSIGKAGMHHLEAEFDFAKTDALHREAVCGVMNPFTDLPMLKQAFTQPEMWPVAKERVQALLERRLITPEQAEQFLTRGAAGSHLEILQRWEGFKGFNKTGVSSIILETDARRSH